MNQSPLPEANIWQGGREVSSIQVVQYIQQKLLISVLHQMNPVHLLPSYFSNIHFNIMLLCRLCLPGYFFQAFLPERCSISLVPKLRSGLFSSFSLISKVLQKVNTSLFSIAVFVNFSLNTGQGPPASSSTSIECPLELLWIPRKFRKKNWKKATYFPVLWKYWLLVIDIETGILLK